MEKMSSLFPDPDAKIYMSLDEIIRMDRGQKDSQLVWRNCRTIKRKKKYPRKGDGEAVAPEHSVPLLTSAGGLDIYVTKQSPLLNAENRRRITQAVSNRVVNSNLIQNSKEIIPAEYKLVKTLQGVERVLVPATEYILRPPRKKLAQPRKLNKTKNTLNSTPNDFLPDKPPPLVPAPIFKPPSPLQDTKMDEPDIVIVEPPECKKKFEVIDVEPDMAGDLISKKDIPVTGPLSVPGSCGQTLNDRFTMLIENFHT